jgi:hypothetical protein
MIVRRSLLGAVAVAVTLVLLGTENAQAQYYGGGQETYGPDYGQLARSWIYLGWSHAAQPRVNPGHYSSQAAAMRHIRQQYPVHHIHTSPYGHVNYGRHSSNSAAIQHLRQAYPHNQIRVGGYGHGRHH